jgi:hypothetical protein
MEKEREEERGTVVERIIEWRVGLHFVGRRQPRTMSLSYLVFCRFLVKYSGIAREQLGWINNQRRVVREGENENENEVALS